MEKVKILLIADIHYIGKAKGHCEIPERKCFLGLELIKRVKDTVKLENFDGIVLLGDIVNDGNAENSKEDFISIKEEIDKLNIPVKIFIPGNHDGDLENFKNIFGQNEGGLIYKNFVFYWFYDKYKEGDICERESLQIEKFLNFIKSYKGKKIIVFQHNPVFPEIESTYPYNLKNSDKIIKLYSENGVFLSVSGHYHKGIELKKEKNVNFLTVPAICEEPFPFLILEINENEIKIERKDLKNPFKLNDNHCHTEFGYCRVDVSMEECIKRVEIFNLGRIIFTEHAGQLYLSNEDYWKGKFFTDPDLIKRAKENGTHRIDDYVEKFKSINSPITKLGIEVEIDKNGKLTLLEEDKEKFEFLAGAVHFLPEEYLKSEKELEKKFLWANECLVKEKVDVIAHPLRFFKRANLTPPKSLYKPLVKIIKEGKAAVEINFHHYIPEIEFFEMCLSEGIKISLGSDAHQIYEVGNFGNHIRFLNHLGIKPEDYEKYLI